MGKRHKLLVAVMSVLLVTSCGGATGDGSQADTAQPADAAPDGASAQYPEWIERVYPPPGSETSATRAVQVNHTAVTAERQVRLTVDGVDVTSYAIETSPGLLEYDVDEAEASPVQLEPGQHTAVVELLDVYPGASEGVDSYRPEERELLGRFEWSFTTL